MSNTREHELDPEEEQDHELNDEDIVEVIEDEGDEPMDDDDDDDNEKYDGEIVIGAPMPGEEEELANMEQMMEDNTLGSTCQSTFHVNRVESGLRISITRRGSIYIHNLPTPPIPKPTTSSIRRRR
jgi:hypothetical protein